MDINKELITDDKVSHIRKILNDLEKYCRENGFKCSLGFGGGTTYSGGLMEWNEDDKKFIQKTEQHIVRTYSNLSFRVTIKDSDYDGKEVNHIKESAKGIVSQLQEPEDFDTHDDE